jgi:N-acetylneuraminic acid mutarotase
MHGGGGGGGGRSLGSTHGRDSYRVGQDLSTAGQGDFSMRGGILTYYNDFVLAFDTIDQKWSRIGVLPYGCITSHCGTNGTHVICIGGEPRHGHNGNAESVVQIGRVTTLSY